MNPVRIGLIGVGIMGQSHLKTLLGMPNDYQVAALCDTDPKRLAIPEAAGIEQFSDYRALLSSGLCDAVCIATPHPCHGEITVHAFQAGLHVLCEKPITVTVSEAGRVIAAADQSGKLFATNFSLRARTVNQAIRTWMKEGRPGHIHRVDFVCTEWFRSQLYYDMQSWRGTWKDEGGGLLMNQAPHNLDLLYFFFGDMSCCRAKIATRFHDIETEDEVTAEFRTKEGIPIRFYANTGEAPGRDMLEIVGDKGTLLREGGKLYFRELEQSISRMLSGSIAFPVPKSKVREIEIPDRPSGAYAIWKNFAAAIRGEEALLAPGKEGIHSVEFANAIMLSHFTGGEVAFPITGKKFDRLLQKLREGTIRLERSLP